MAAQVISEAAAPVSFVHLGKGEAQTRHYVVGKTWNWDNNPEINFIESAEELKDALAEAQSVAFTTATEVEANSAE